MQAVIFPAPETMAIEQVSDPACGPDEVIVQVAAAGICGTDVHIYRNEYMSDFPVIPGQFLQFGVTPKDATIKLRPYDVFHRDWTIIGSFALCYTFEPAIAWLAAGVVDVSPLISHTVPLTDFPDLFQQFAAGQTLKVHLQPG